MYEFVILGAGGMGRETCEVLVELYGDNPDYRVKGFLSDVLDVLDGYDVGYPLLGTIKDYEVQPNDRFVLAIGDVAGRRKIAESILERGGEFFTLIHPSARVYPSAKIGKGAIIFPYAFVGANATVGDYCLINIYAACGHDVNLGAFSEMAPHAVLGGGAVLGEECFIAISAVVAPKTKLGDRVVVSQGSAVQKDQNDDVLVLGVPGKTLRKIGI